MIPGVPSVPASVNLFASVALLVSDLINSLLGFGAPEWGIFQDGFSLVEADSVISLGYKQDWAISTYPVEEGAFQSYNKVDTPYTARVRFATGGSQSDRQNLLDSIAAIAGTLDLYDVVTPEQIYTNANVVAYSYTRTSSNGVGLIQVDVQLVEVRVSATADFFANTKSASAKGQINDGTVQSNDLTPAQLQSVQSQGF